jgi:hypothetical protein
MGIAMEHRALAVGLITGLVIQCGPAAVRHNAIELAGCYNVQLGSWSVLPSQPAVLYAPPPAFRLDTTQRRSPLGALLGGMRVAPVSPSAPHGNNFPPGWELVPGDSLHVFWSDGFAGIELRLAIAQDSLRGIAQEASDASDPSWKPGHASALATHVPCLAVGL